MAAYSDDSNFPKTPCPQCGSGPAILPPLRQEADPKVRHHHPNPIPEGATPTSMPEANLRTVFPEVAKISDPPRLEASIPTVTRVSSGTSTNDLVTGNRLTERPPPSKSETRIGRTREDYLIWKLVSHVSKHDLDLTDIRVGFLEEELKMSKSSRRVVNTARMAIIHHEYWKRSPKMGVENLLDKFLADKDSQQKVFWAKRAIQMHEAALAVSSRDNKSPTRTTVSRELANQAKNSDSDQSCHSRGAPYPSARHCDPWQPGRAPGQTHQVVQLHQPSSPSSTPPAWLPIPCRLPVRPTMYGHQDQNSHDSAQPSSQEVAGCEQWSRNSRTLGPDLGMRRQ